MTFAIERHLGELCLMVDNGRGCVRRIATFGCDFNAELFKEALAMAKAAAHAHGQSGI